MDHLRNKKGDSFQGNTRKLLWQGNRGIVLQVEREGCFLLVSVELLKAKTRRPMHFCAHLTLFLHLFHEISGLPAMYCNIIIRGKILT